MRCVPSRRRVPIVVLARNDRTPGRKVAGLGDRTNADAAALNAGSRGWGCRRR